MNSLKPASASRFSAAGVPGKIPRPRRGADNSVPQSASRRGREKQPVHSGKLWFDYGKNGIEFFRRLASCCDYGFTLINQPINHK
jgi:hypothetical protein